MAARLESVAVAAFARGLQAHGDQANASHVVGVALSRDVRQVADFIRTFFASQDSELADSVLAEAARVRAPADRIVLATLLLGGLSREVEDRI
jgi:hypothetical protein